MTNTNTVSKITEPRGLKRKIRVDYYEYLPKYEKQQACYKSAILTNIDPRHSRKEQKQEPQTWPYTPSMEEIKYNSWKEKVVNDKTNKFYGQKDRDTARAISDTGSWRTIRSICRLKRANDEEFLLSKQDLHGWSKRGDVPISVYIPYPEVWTRQHWSYRIEWNENSREEESQLEGPGEAELVYDLPFTKENLKTLYDERQDDRTIQFVVKDEATGKAVEVKDLSGSSQKSFELFKDSTWENLFKGNYIPAPIKQELRAEAVAQGLIQGGVGDYNSTSSQPAKGVYK